MLSPSVSVTTPEGASLPATSSRRRGLTYLRNLSQSRSSTGSNPESSRTSPRHYFQRSISYTETRDQSAGIHSRRRSNSRPNEPTSPLAGGVSLTRVLSTGAPANQESQSSPTSPVRRSRSLRRQLQGNITEATEENHADIMARRRPSSSRRHTSGAQPSDATASHPNEATEGSRPKAARTASSRVTSNATGESQDGESKQQLPTIRFFPHQELRNGRQSLNFPPVSRTLPSESSIIRVGRYSEREGIPAANPSTPSDAPVGFKSKVVSRKHCEFSFLNGQWHVKDVASSSGTFLNHIRLSQPNTESKPFAIKDGDIVQLGIDFRGGEEMIFRCVKIRIECNRAWQKKPNNFNKSRHAQLQTLAKDQPTTGANSGECSICLGPILPCQALFVAPCAHVWHYKCIRPLLEGKNSASTPFQCPNCRAYADLTADVDVAESDMDEWMENGPDGTEQGAQTDGDAAATTANAGDTTIITSTTTASTTASTADDSPEEIITPSAGSSALLARRQAAHPGSPEIEAMGGIDMPSRSSEDDIQTQLDQQRTRVESPDIDVDQIIAGEGPLTPRNNAGPFVFDGSASTGSSRRLTVPSLSEVAEERS